MSFTEQAKTVTTRHSTTTALVITMAFISVSLAGCFPHARRPMHPGYPGAYGAQGVQQTQVATASASVAPAAQPVSGQAVASPFEGVAEAPSASPAPTLVEPAPPVVAEAPAAVASTPSLPTAPAGPASPAVQATAPATASAPVATGAISVTIAARPQFHALMQRSQMMMGMGQYRQALRILNTARRFRQHPAILFNMAICLEHIGDVRRAAAIYQRVASDPTVGARASERVSVLMGSQAGYR